MRRRPTRRRIETRVEDLGAADGDGYADAEKYHRWFARGLVGDIGPDETPPAGLDEWIETPAGQEHIQRSIDALREARERVRRERRRERERARQDDDDDGDGDGDGG